MIDPEALIPFAPTDRRVRTFLDAMPALVWGCGADGSCDYFNTRWAEYTGVPMHEHYGTGWQCAVHPDDRERTADAWSAAVASDAPYDVAYRLRRHDGTYRWFKARGFAVRDDGGAIVRWLGMTMDIDDQRRAQESLRFLAGAGDVLAASLDIGTTLTVFAELVTRDFADWCCIFIAESEGSGVRPVALAHRDPAKRELLRTMLRDYPVDRRDPVVAALLAGEPVALPAIAPDVLAAGGRAARHAALLADVGMRGELLVPLIVRDRVIGFMQIVESTNAAPFSGSDMDLAQQLAKRAAIAIDNAQLYAAERRSADRLRFLARAGEALSESLDRDETVRALLRLVAPEYADWAVLNLVDPDGAVRPAVIYHPDPARADAVETCAQLHLLDPTCRYGRARVIRTQQPERIELRDACELDELLAKVGITGDAAAAVRALGYAASLTVPLIVDGRVRGVFAGFRSQPGRPYTDDDVPLFSELARRAASAIQNADNYERERRVADTLQRALLPSSLPAVDGIDLAATYVPGESEANVGGDWYDAFTLPDGRLAISIGDVTGRGLRAAVTMGKVRQAINTLSVYESDPARLLDAVDRELRRAHPEAIVTATVGVADPRDGTFSYATAGHPLPFLRAPDGSLTQLPARGLPLGLRGTAEPPTATIQLPSGSLLVFYTDGLIESTRDVTAGEASVVAALADPAVTDAADPATALRARVLGDASHDDVAILTVRLRHAGATKRPWSMRWSFDATDARLAHDVRDLYMRYLRQRLQPDDDYAAAELIFGELIGNVVRHAPGPVDVELEWWNLQPVLNVIDRGPGFERRPAGLPAGVFAESGRGLFLVDALAQHFDVQRRPERGTHARAVLRRA